MSKNTETVGKYMEGFRSPKGPWSLRRKMANPYDSGFAMYSSCGLEGSSS